MKYRHGGTLADIPEPHKRYFDDKRRKPMVTVSVTRYDGIGTHYYVRLSLEDNPLWNSKDECWQVSWDDKEARGYQRDRRFTNVIYAR